MEPLVTTEWLQAHLDDPQIRILDASWHMPQTGRDPAAEFDVQHIPGAVFFDIDAISDRASTLPHMLPPPDVFAAQVGALGVGSESLCVVYDSNGLFSAPRVWWMFRAMGHDNIVVLDGGLPKWLSEGRRVDALASPRPNATFVPAYRGALVRDLDSVRSILVARSPTVLDARSADRFSGEAPEPRAGLRSGHMPGARNLPWGGLIAADGTMRPAEELEAVFRSAGVEPAKPVICSCGSGVSAAILALALARLGHWDTPIYDGSWTEWASRDDTAISIGA